MANSVDPDETPHSAASHLGLYCLLRPVCPNIYGKYGNLFFCWGLTTRPLWVILCCLPTGRRGIEKMKERDRGERKMNDSEETEEIKTFPLYPYLLQQG